ncbi:DUF928 domain-containing protein [Phormidium tenue FACHB-886]|nr:DUF928 domain-containing protein [Phormidium tenue FACHB-886]
MKLPRQIQRILVLLTILLGGLQVQAQPSTAPTDSSPADSTTTFVAPPPPPNIDSPGRPVGGGTRRNCGESIDQVEPTEQPLTALVPTSPRNDLTYVFGATGAERPTFWFYVPYSASFTAVFSLQDQAGNAVYETEVALPETASAIGITLPATVPPLESNKLYHWYFEVYCQAPPPEASVDGWVQRRLIDQGLNQQIEQASLPQRVSLYAANGLWHDALTTAAELHRADPTNPAWRNLLQAIGLGDLPAEPIAAP